MAWEKVREHLGDSQKQVFNCIFYNRSRDGITNLEIARTLGWDINRVTPRTNELRKMAYVEELMTRPCKVTGNMAMAWVLVDDPLARRISIAPKERHRPMKGITLQMGDQDG
jgi:hypothetical protein